MSTSLVIASTRELSERALVWGTGGWLDPEQREALDWLTLVRFLGWEARVEFAEERPSPSALVGATCAIVACPSDALRAEWRSLIEAHLEREKLLMVARSSRAAPGNADPSFNDLRWIGPGRSRTWRCAGAGRLAEIAPDPQSRLWASFGRRPMIVARTAGRGQIVTLAFHPSAARDVDGAYTALLRQLLINGSQRPVAWLDFNHTMVLRMDDPGSAQSVHNTAWSYPKLREEAWSEIAADLRRRHGRVSIAYVPGWVDDGNARRGTLEVNGSPAERRAGAVHPSPLVVYRGKNDRDGSPPSGDYVSEYHAIQALRASHLGDVELHGYTHMHPDLDAWSSAPDRYENMAWFREFGAAANAAIARLDSQQHPLRVALKTFARFFGSRPTTLVPPGDEWTDGLLVVAHELGFSLVDSYYMAVRDGSRFVWAMHVCSPYIDRADPSWFTSGLPVVGYFHDYEPATLGTAWLREQLDRWQNAGAHRFIDMRQLAAVLGIHLQVRGNDGRLALQVTRGEVEPVMPVRIGIALTDDGIPDAIDVEIDGVPVSLRVDRAEDGNGIVELPVSGSGNGEETATRES